VTIVKYIHVEKMACKLINEYVSPLTQAISDIIQNETKSSSFCQSWRSPNADTHVDACP